MRLQKGEATKTGASEPWRLCCHQPSPRATPICTMRMSSRGESNLPKAHSGRSHRQNLDAATCPGPLFTRRGQAGTGGDAKLPWEDKAPSQPWRKGQCRCRDWRQVLATPREAPGGSGQGPRGQEGTSGRGQPHLASSQKQLQAAGRASRWEGRATVAMEDGGLVAVLSSAVSPHDPGQRASPPFTFPRGTMTG